MDSQAISPEGNPRDCDGVEAGFSRARSRRKISRANTEILERNKGLAPQGSATPARAGSNLPRRSEKEPRIISINFPGVSAWHFDREITVIKSPRLFSATELSPLFLRALRLGNQSEFVSREANLIINWPIRTEPTVHSQTVLSKFVIRFMRVADRSKPAAAPALAGWRAHVTA